MTDKFLEYMNKPGEMENFSQYVHQNMKIINTKMLSEMRRKLEMGDPDMSNSNGYVSLMASLYGRMFSEMFYGMCGFCQALKCPASEMINIVTLSMLTSLLQGKNPLNGLPRSDVKEDKQEFERLYLECIDHLRKVTEALPR